MTQICFILIPCNSETKCVNFLDSFEMRAYTILCVHVIFFKLQRITTRSWLDMEFLLKISMCHSLRSWREEKSVALAIVSCPHHVWHLLSSSVEQSISSSFSGLKSLVCGEALHQAESLTLYTWHTVGARNPLYSTLIGGLQKVPLQHHLDKYPHFTHCSVSHRTRHVKALWRELKGDTVTS